MADPYDNHDEQDGGLRLRLVDSDGYQIGIVDYREAEAIASQRELVLVEVNDQAVPPVYRLMTATDARDERRAAPDPSPVVLREVRVASMDELDSLDVAGIDEHLADGDKVKITVISVGPLRGRDASELFASLCDRLSVAARVERGPEREGLHLAAYVAPE